MTIFEAHQQYMRGWRHGASQTPMESWTESEEIQLYESGYVAGQKSKREASDTFAKKIGLVLYEIKALSRRCFVMRAGNSK